METGESVLRKRRITPAASSTPTPATEETNDKPAKTTTEADKQRNTSLPLLPNKHGQFVAKQLKVAVPAAAVGIGTNKAVFHLNKFSKSQLHHSSRAQQAGRAVTNRSCIHTSKEGATPLHHKFQLENLKAMSACECGGGDDSQRTLKMAKPIQKAVAPLPQPERLNNVKVDNSGVADTGGGGTKCSESVDAWSEEVLSETSKGFISMAAVKDNQTKNPRAYYLYLILLTVGALYMRLFNIEVPDHIW